VTAAGARFGYLSSRWLTGEYSRRCTLRRCTRHLSDVAGGSWAVKLAADAQAMEASFTTMFGSAEKAKAMMSDIQSFAASTPFESPEIAQATKSLVAFGIAQDQAIPSMRMLGDLASGLGIPLNDLAQIYGKARVQGRLFAEDMNQLQGRGIPVAQALAANFGVNEDKIRGMVEAGQVGFPQLQAALYSLTKEGSMFGGAMEKQSQTFWGQWSSLMDNLKIAFGGVGKMFIGTLTEMLKIVNSALESWNKFWGNTPKDAGKFAPLDMKLIEQGMKPMEQAVDKVKEAADAAAKAIEDMNKQGAALAQSLRTPGEKFVDDARHFQKLLTAGAISGETYARAMAKAREELDGQARSAQQIRDNLARQQGGPVAALQFGTQAAISAISQSQREQKLELEVERQILAEQRKANEIANRLLQEARRNGAVEIREVNL
jgi:tape measure domain-containing protein